MIVVNAKTLETDLAGVYAGGDAVDMAGSVIHAIAAGRRAAESIDRALGGSGTVDEIFFRRNDPDPYIGHDHGFAPRHREIEPELDAATRIRSFNEIVTGFSAEQARRAAGRCLQCDLRLQLGCNPAPPQDWQPFGGEHINHVPDTEGVFQLLDADRNVLSIKGTANLRRGLLQALETNSKNYNPGVFYQTPDASHHTIHLSV